MPPLPPLTLRGVDHTARPTWKLRETIEFYRDKLGLPLVHVISARGWGPATHPDFLHLFFDSGNGSSIAFFYSFGTLAGGAFGPLIFGHLIGSESRTPLYWGYLAGATVMILAGLAQALWGVASECKPLEALLVDS